MRTYSVFAPPVLPGSLEEDARSLVFVRHGWSLAALFVPLIWMLVRRLWWVLLAYIVLIIALQVASYAVPPIVSVALSVGLALVIMIEAGQLRLESVAAKGYREIAVIHAPNLREAEVRFLAQWMKERGETAPTPLPAEGLPARRPRTGGLLRPRSANPPPLPGLPS
jgi:hypothetical protein